MPPRETEAIEQIVPAHLLDEAAVQQPHGHMDVFLAGRLHDVAGIGNDRLDADDRRMAVDDGEFGHSRAQDAFVDSLGAAAHEPAAKTGYERVNARLHSCVARFRRFDGSVREGVDRPVVRIEDIGAVVSEIGVHPGAEIYVDPIAGRVRLYRFHRIVPDRHALLVMGNPGLHLRDDQRDQAFLPVEGYPIGLLPRPRQQNEDRGSHHDGRDENGQCGFQQEIPAAEVSRILFHLSCLGSESMNGCRPAVRSSGPCLQRNANRLAGSQKVPEEKPVSSQQRRRRSPDNVDSAPTWQSLVGSGWIFRRPVRGRSRVHVEGLPLEHVQQAGVQDHSFSRSGPPSPAAPPCRPRKLHGCQSTSLVCPGS